MIYMLLADGFEEVEALAPLDLLRRGGLEVKTIGVTGTVVKGSHGISVTADISPDEANDRCELLILPGGMPGAANLDKADITDKLISAVLREGGHLAAICAAPFILGKRGILRNKSAICFPGFENYLDGAKIASTNVITDGNVTTAIGMGAAIDFGIELLRVMLGENAAKKIENTILGR